MPESTPAVTYRRVSTGRQAEGESLTTQLEAIKGYCKTHNLYVHRHYCDRGKSGRSTKGRDEFTQALDHAKKLGGRLVAYKLDRLGRDIVTLAQLLRELKEAGGDVAFVMDSIDTAGPTGELTYHILSSIAQYRSGVIGEHVKAANSRKVRELGYRTMATQPAGFMLTKDKKRRIECPSEMKVIRQIFDLWDNHDMGSRRIAKALNERGLLTIMQMRDEAKGKPPRKTKGWGFPSVEKILARRDEYAPYLNGGLKS